MCYLVFRIHHIIFTVILRFPRSFVHPSRLFYFFESVANFSEFCVPSIFLRLGFSIQEHCSTSPVWYMFDLISCESGYFQYTLLRPTWIVVEGVSLVGLLLNIVLLLLRFELAVCRSTPVSPSRKLLAWIPSTHPFVIAFAAASAAINEIVGCVACHFFSILHLKSNTSFFCIHADRSAPQPVLFSCLLPIQI